MLSVDAEDDCFFTSESFNWSQPSFTSKDRKFLELLKGKLRGSEGTVVGVGNGRKHDAEDMI